jgi:SAM-dependent methyltransferase
MTNRFSREDARRFHDSFGSKQDAQGFYEDAALDALVEHSEFSLAQSVLEIGCGTGRLAARLLADCLPASAAYVGVDISETMAGLAWRRLGPWSGRARDQVSGGDFDSAPAAVRSTGWPPLMSLIS